MLPLSADKRIGHECCPYPRISPLAAPGGWFGCQCAIIRGVFHASPGTGSTSVTLSADKGNTSDLLARQWPTRPARSPDRATPAIGLRPFGPETVPRTVSGTGLTPRRALRFRRAGRCPSDGSHICSGKGVATYPRIRAGLLTYSPGPDGWFAGTEARPASTGAAYPRIRATSLTYWRVSGQPVPPGRKTGSRLCSGNRGVAYPRIRAGLLTYSPGPDGWFAGTEA